MDQAERLAIVQEMQQRIYEQVPVVALAYPSNIQAYRNDRFTGWTPHPGPSGYLLAWYNNDSVTTVRPAAGAETSDVGLPVWTWILVGVAVVGIAIVAIRRSGRRREEEA